MTNDQIDEKEAEKIYDFLQKIYNRCRGNNSEWYPEDRYICFEAPNNATVSCHYDDCKTLIEVAKCVMNALDDFSVNGTFNELWCPEFANHNSFTPSGFLQMLQEDKKFFTKAAVEIRKIRLRDTKEAKNNPNLETAIKNEQA